MKKNDDILYNINDLRVVMIDKNYIEYKINGYVNYFNNNIKFIVEKVLINETNKDGEPYFAEYYTECITEEDLSERISDKPFTDNPKIFSLISRIPPQYLTSEELKTNKISLMRIYKLFQDININNEKIEGKPNRKGKKRLKKSL